MSSHEGYADAIHQKVDSIYQIHFNPYNYNTFDTLKHWLYDHNEGEGSIGGLASIAILTGESNQAQLPNNEWIFTQLGTDSSTGHVVTIVGYDDEIFYDLNNNGHIDQDEHGAFRVANSWGTSWSSGGFIWLPYKLMRNLQDNRRMAFCCTVKECEPTVFINATWVHPHQYKRRKSFYFNLATKNQSDMEMTGSGTNYPIFSAQGGNNTLQGINEADTLALCFDFSTLFPDLDNAGKYFIKAYNTSNTIGNKFKNFSLVDCRWNEVFELQCDSTEYSIDYYSTIIGIKYELLPFIQPITSSRTYNRDLVARRTVNISGNTTVTMNKPTVVNMYGTDLFDSEIIVGENATLRLTDSVRIIAKRGDCRVIVKGSLTLGNGVTFEACDGATLEIIFENNVDLAISNATFINCTLDLPSQNLSFDHCHFDGTPLEMNNTTSDQSSTAIVTNCTFTSNGSNISNAVCIKSFAHYKVSGCTIGVNGGGAFKNGIAIYNSGSNSGWKQVSSNVVSGCLQAGIQLYASSGNITMNTVYGNGYGIKLLNNCNIASLSGNCGATLESGTQYIHDNANNEVYMTGSSVPQRFRYNAIHHYGNTPFVYHDAYVAFGGEGEWPVRGSIDVKYNYWGSGFSPSTHLYTSLDGGTYEYNPEWILGNCYNEWVDAAMLLDEADSLNEAGAYDDAQLAYKRVVENHPETVSAETALKSLLQLEAQLEGDYLSLKEYYLTNSTIAADETLLHLASSLANKCDEKMENFTEAISWYEEVLTSPSTNFNDSIFAAIDLGDLYLRMETIGEKSVGRLTQYKPESEVLYKRQTDYALSLMPKERCYSIDLPSVSNLEISVGENDTISLNWYYPESFEPQNEQSLSWSIGNVYDQWGGPCGECNWSVAHRYEERDLEGLIGWKIKSVSIIPWREVDVYEIRIWKGTLENYSLVYGKVVENPILQGWTSVAIDEDIYIENGQEYFMGYKAYAPGGYFLPMDDKPVAHNKGDLIEYNPNQGWMTTGYYYGNFMISTVLESEEGRVAKAAHRGDALTGYRVYRDGTMIAEIPYTFQTYFTDTEFSKNTDVEYCVTAVYGDEESELVCATANITGVDEQNKVYGITVAPNPTNSLVTVMGKGLRSAEVVNMLGQHIISVSGDGDELQIDMASLPSGVYFIEIADAEGKRCVKKVMKE